MKIAIIKYNAGNTQSVINALTRLGIDPILTDDKQEILSADKVIFPGVGEAATTMNHLNELKLAEFIPSLKQPVLGICLGMQLMCRYSEENNTKCMGIFELDVLKFKPLNSEQVPHMGWNTLKNTSSPLLTGLEDEHVYFVHSYYVPLNDNSIATTDYIHPYCSAINKDNFYAVQFHPEKSSIAGARILDNFIKL